MRSRSFQEYSDELGVLAKKLLGCGALKEMRKKFSPSSREATQAERYDSLERVVITACAGAVAYRGKRADEDYYEVHRKGEAKFFADLAGGISAGKKFVSFVRRHIDFMPSPTVGLLNRKVRLTGGRPRELPLVVLEECLAALSKAEGDHELVSGDADYLYQAGPIHVGEKIEAVTASQVQLPSTALAFQLAFYFRLFTEGHTVHADYCIAAPMPRTGKPCWPIVAALTAGTLGGDLDPVTLARRMNKLSSSYPDMVFMGWEEEGHWKDLRTRPVK